MSTASGVSADRGESTRQLLRPLRREVPRVPQERSGPEGGVRIRREGAIVPGDQLLGRLDGLQQQRPAERQSQVIPER